MIASVERQIRAVDDACRKFRLRPDTVLSALAAAQERLAELERDLDLGRLKSDLEEAKLNAVRRLEALQADYAAAVTRAGSRAEKRLAPTREEIDRTREHLAEVLANLVETAERALAAPALPA